MSRGEAAAPFLGRQGEAASVGPGSGFEILQDAPALSGGARPASVVFDAQDDLRPGGQVHVGGGGAGVVGDVAEHREQVAGEQWTRGSNPSAAFMSVTKPSTCTLRLCSPARARVARR